MDDNRDYWAFVSYRHLDNKDAGREWATWIAREIETYEVPPELVGTTGNRGEPIPERIYPVFRDEDELSADADLSSPIFEALRNSKTLIVVCSPRAVSSRYVGNEIAYFKSLGRGDRVLAMMIEGEPHDSGDRECFPAELKHAVDDDGNLLTETQVEPVAADFRLSDGNQGWHSPAQSRAHFPDTRSAEKYEERCNLAKLKLIAGILGVPLGKLIERDKAYQLTVAKRKAKVFTAVAAAMSILAVLAIVGGVYSVMKRNEAAAERDRAQRSEQVALHARGTAEELISQMLFEMGNKLEPLGRLDLLEDVSLSAESYFAGLPADQIDTDSERNRSVMLDSRGRILKESGNLEGALEYYSDGLEIVKELAAENPDNLVLENDVVVSLQQVADVQALQNRQEEAIENYEEAIARLQRLTEKHVGAEESQRITGSLLGEDGSRVRDETRKLLSENPEIGGLMATSAVLMDRLGKIAFQHGRFEDAESHFKSAVDIQKALQVVDPESTQIKTSLYSGINDLGNTAIQRLQTEAAVRHFEEAVSLAETELEKDPANVIWREKLANGLSRLGVAVSMTGDSETYRDLQLRAMQEYRALSDGDPTNITRLRNLLVGLTQIGLAEKSLGNYEAARKHLRESGEIAATLIETDPTNSLWRQDYAFSLAQQADIQRLAGFPEKALEMRHRELKQQRIVSEGHPENLLYRKNLVYTLNATGIGYWALEKLEDAVRFLTESESLAATIVEDLAEPIPASYKDLHDVRTYLSNIEEQRERFTEAVEWYEKAINIARIAHAEGTAWENVTPEAFELAEENLIRLKALLPSPESAPVEGGAE